MEKLYIIKDIKGKIFTGIRHFLNENLARRDFIDLVNKEQNIQVRPEDYELWEIGEFDRESGLTYIHDEKIFIMSGVPYTDEQLKNYVNSFQSMEVEHRNNIMNIDNEYKKWYMQSQKISKVDNKEVK